jgi:prephenate dehydrogenase
VSGVLVVGTGLIGGSLGLALTGAGRTVWLTDTDKAAVDLAADLGAGQQWQGQDVEMVVLAVPPSVVPAECRRWQEQCPDATVTDVASVKSQVVHGVEQVADPRRFVGGHPVAGREVAGARGARADLFIARPWVLTPEGSESARVDAVEQLILTVGAVPVRMTAEQHDEAMALVSHAPQVAASVMAGLLADADPALVDLAGQGLRDTTRIAAGDPALWSDILLGNREAVLPVLDRLSRNLDDLRSALQSADGDSVRTGLGAGVVGRSRIPGKHGGSAASYTPVTVVIDDAPGALARLLVAAGEAGVNVEDLRLEHSPGQPVGLVELSVRPDAAAELAAALAQAGWRVHAEQRQ